MGSQVIAKCECGLAAEIMIGGGMINFMNTCYFPCHCNNCHNVVEVNLLAETMTCQECGATNPTPYDDPELMESASGHIVAQWNVEERLGRKLFIYSNNYKCPKCGKMTLLFADSGLCWD